ncbi:MAG TPA: HD domain-containing phosphohydrolase [Gemmatimonadales bacterium]|nr:HD domain-containing phosphohydrolase [Gemmatimonadales bacterium]
MSEHEHPGAMESLQTTDGYIRTAGREFLTTFYTALRSLKLYPLENPVVQKALDDISTSVSRIVESEQELEVRLTGEFIFVNSTRLRLDLDNYASFSHVLGLLKACGVGLVRSDQGDRREWTSFLSLLISAASKGDAANRFFDLQSRMRDANILHILVEPIVETEEDEQEEERLKEQAKKTYQRSVAVTKEVINSVRMGRTASVKKVKRAVQAIVDQVLANETSLIGLTTLRDYDDYTFVHSVNVCIFSVSLGRKLGLTKLQLYDLGMAALFHDIGKSRVPLEVLNKTGGLTDEEWRIMQAHPWLGVLTLFGLRGYGEIPYRSMIAAFEHHMKLDLSGYPRTIRPRVMSIFSRIIATADGFDAATSRRSYHTVPLEPDVVLKEMWENPKRGLDPIVVKAFINLIGIYPVGTMVILDTYELAIVTAPNPVPEAVNRPLVRVVSDRMGTIIFPGFDADLYDRNEDGTFVRSIIKVTSPEKYGVRVADYFV